MLSGDRAHLAAGLDRQRLIAMLCLTAVLLAAILIPPLVVSKGWVPRDDVLRHVAKAISGRPWSDVLVLRPDATLDPHPGWHWILSQVHRQALPRAGQLVAFSVCLLATLVMIAPLSAFRRPEAWLLTLLLATISEPIFLIRLFLGRPYLVSMAVLLVLCATWPRAKEQSPGRWLLGMTLLFVLSNWCHGNAYLWLLPLGAFVLAGEFRVACLVGACVVVGASVSACLTGHPIAFLVQTQLHPFRAVASGVPSWVLAAEFQPSGGTTVLLAALTGAVLLTRRRSRFRLDIRDPLLILAVGGWIAGLSTGRFWYDWGLPPTLLLVARQVEAWMEDEVPSTLFTRGAVVLAVSAAATLAISADTGRRWSSENWKVFAPVFRKENRSWLPAPGGIAYNSSMNIFYVALYQDPMLSYRFIQGFEPGMMPDDDLQILRTMQEAGVSDESLVPWARKLRPIDRLVITRNSPTEPKVPGIEWLSPTPGVWLGRTKASP